MPHPMCLKFRTFTSWNGSVITLIQYSLTYVFFKLISYNYFSQILNNQYSIFYFHYVLEPTLITQAWNEVSLQKKVALSYFDIHEVSWWWKCPPIYASGTFKQINFQFYFGSGQNFNWIFKYILTVSAVYGAKSALYKRNFWNFGFKSHRTERIAVIGQKVKLFFIWIQKSTRYLKKNSRAKIWIVSILHDFLVFDRDPFQSVGLYLV